MSSSCVAHLLYGLREDQNGPRPSTFAKATVRQAKHTGVTLIFAKLKLFAELDVLPNRTRPSIHPCPADRDTRGHGFSFLRYHTFPCNHAEAAIAA